MIPTIRSILAGPAVQAGQPEVLSGSGRLDRPVRWVHVSEVREVADLLEGDELLLSTGLAMRGVGRGGRRLRGGARSTAGAAGLIVELGEQLPSVPAAALELARSADFPLVVLHRQARFVLITEEVHRGIVADRFDFVRFAQDVHETFTALSLEGAGVEELVRAGAEMAGSSIVLEDLNRRVVAFHAIGRPGRRPARRLGAALTAVPAARGHRTRRARGLADHRRRHAWPRVGPPGRPQPGGGPAAPRHARGARRPGRRARPG